MSRRGASTNRRPGTWTGSRAGGLWAGAERRGWRGGSERRGPPVAGYAEYDALPAQSQAPEPRRKPRDGTSFRAAGHTDPHSALGIGSVGGWLGAEQAGGAHGVQGA